jgi:hypothetical protein
MGHSPFMNNMNNMNKQPPLGPRQARIQDALDRAKKEQLLALKAKLAGKALRAEQHEVLADMWLSVAIREAHTNRAA